MLEIFVRTQPENGTIPAKETKYNVSEHNILILA